MEKTEQTKPMEQKTEQKSEPLALWVSLASMVWRRGGAGGAGGVDGAGCPRSAVADMFSAPAEF